VGQDCELRVLSGDGRGGDGDVAGAPAADDEDASGLEVARERDGRAGDGRVESFDQLLVEREDVRADAEPLSGRELGALHARAGHEGSSERSEVLEDETPLPGSNDSRV